MPHDIILPIWPSVTNCLAWSQDSDIAIVAEGHVQLLIPKLNLYNLNLSQSYDNLWTTLHLRVDQFTEDEVQVQEPLSFANFSIGEELSNGSVVALAWSPQGLARNKRCVLAVLTSNCVLSIWAPGADPSELSEWSRVLVVNHSLQHFQSHESLNGLDDDGKLEIGKRKQRVEAFAWSPPLNLSTLQHESGFSNAADGAAWLALSNDCNEVIILRIQSDHHHTAAQKKNFKAIVVGSFSISSFDHTNPTTLMDTFEDSMAKHKVVGQIAWSSWFPDKKSTPEGHDDIWWSSFLAYATLSKVAIRQIHFDPSKGLIIASDGFLNVVSASRHLDQLQWFPKVHEGCLHLFVTCPEQIRRYGIPLMKPSAVRVADQLSQRWDEVSGMAAGIFPGDEPVLFSSRFISTGSARPSFPITAKGSNRKAFDTPPEWIKKVHKQRDEFNNANHLDGHVVSKVWGLSSSPLGNFIATISTQHPDDLPEYIIPADYRSAFTISNTLDNETLRLPSSGGNADPQDLSSETLVFSLLAWLNAHKDIRWDNSSIYEDFIKTLKEACIVTTTGPHDHDSAINDDDLSLEEYEKSTMIKYLRRNLYEANDAQSRRCEHLVSLLDPSSEPKALNEEGTLRTLSSVVSKIPSDFDRSKTSKRIRALYIEACRVLGGLEVSNSANGHGEDFSEYCGICGSDVLLPFNNLRYASGTCGHQFGKPSGMRAISH